VTLIYNTTGENGYGSLSVALYCDES